MLLFQGEQRIWGEISVRRLMLRVRLSYSRFDAPRHTWGGGGAEISSGDVGRFRRREDRFGIAIHDVGIHEHLRRQLGWVPFVIIMLFARTTVFTVDSRNFEWKKDLWWRCMFLGRLVKYWRIIWIHIVNIKCRFDNRIGIIFKFFLQTFFYPNLFETWISYFLWYILQQMGDFLYS